MRILVVNDDGIHAEGIHRLAKMAKKLGEVWVVAPDSQCSAMSHRITVCGNLTVRQTSIPVDGVKSFSVSGTPADCVKVALAYVMPQKPDVVFSGINNGYNAGIDLLYSGTVGAAMEGILNGIPAIAFSTAGNGIFDVVDEYLYPVTKELLEEKLPANEIWNVNFPGCALSEMKGILRDRRPAQSQYYLDHYEKKENPDGSIELYSAGVPVKEGEEGTDIDAVLKNYISIGRVKSAVLESGDN